MSSFLYLIKPLSLDMPEQEIVKLVWAGSKVIQVLACIPNKQDQKQSKKQVVPWLFDFFDPKKYLNFKEQSNTHEIERSKTLKCKMQCKCPNESPSLL